MKFYFSLLWIAIVLFNSALYVSSKENINNLSDQSKYLFLLEDIYNSFDQLKKDPENTVHQQDALHVYNFLRELLKQQPAQSFKDINKSWLAQQLYASWIEKKQEQWKEKNITTLTERAQDLLTDIDEFFTTEPKEDPNKGREYLIHEDSLLALIIEDKFAYSIPEGVKELLKTIDSLWDEKRSHWNGKTKSIESEHTIDTKLIFYYNVLIKLFKPVKSYPDIESFLNSTNWLFDILTKDPESTAYRQETLYAYNLLKQLLKQQPVESFKDIDTSWLDTLRTTGDTFLSLLLQNKSEEALKIITDQNHLLLADSRTDGWTPLLLIAGDTRMDKTTRLQLAQELLARGADVHARRNGISVLAFASGIGGTSVDLVELLITHGANEFEQAYHKAINWSRHYKDHPEHTKIINILRDKLLPK